MSIVYGCPAGGFGMPKLIEIADGNGNTFIGAVTDSEVALDATRADVKAGKMFAANEGIQEGEDTKTYRTTHASCLVRPGESFTIPLDKYDMYNYTKFQAVIAEFNTTQIDSTSVNKIVLNDKVYNTNSTVKLSDITKNSSTKSVDLNIINSTDKVYVIHYNTYKEE